LETDDPRKLLAELKAKGKAQTVKTYRRHGVQGDIWGVSYADLGVMTRRIGVDHPVALALWKSGVHDARVLATKVADPDAASDTQLNEWIGECDDAATAGAVAELAARTASAEKTALLWIDDRREWTSMAGWNVIARLAANNRLRGTLASRLLKRIEKTIAAAPNMTRYAMNGALIAIGGYVEPLRADAIALAERLGHVDVDHGDTACMTPEAVAYIGKIAERQKSRRR